MDPTQTKALNALEPYILLSKSATSPRAAADLITQATSAPNTYVFAELLQTPNIQALRTASPENAAYLTLLEIFAWGTWADYTSTPSLPPLNPPQTQKLHQLTLLSLATSPTTLTYPHLLTALSLPTVRSLEDLVISAIYAGLLSAKLDTLAARVDVTSVAPLRDLRPGSVPGMVAVLEEWERRCVGVLGEIEGQVGEVRRRAGERRRREGEGERVLERAVEERDGGGGGGKGRGLGLGLGKRGAGDGEGGGVDEGFGGEEMEVDEGVGRSGVRNAKRGGGRFAGVGRRLG